MVARASRAGNAVIETDFPAEDKFDHLPDSATPQGVTAFLTIQEGCDKFCSFCVVPYTRGAEQSRPADAILREAKHLVSQGAREITLLGQNVNAWHGGETGASAVCCVTWLNPRPVAAALCDLPPARHGRRPDRRPPRYPDADAVPASAGAVRLRPHPGGYEPQAHRG